MPSPASSQSSCLCCLKSTKGKKLIRLSPRSKKKNSRGKDQCAMRNMDAASGGSATSNDKLPNGMTDRERQELRQAFDMFDKNHDGKISSEELNCVLRTLGHRYTADEIEEMIKNADTNENGYVEWEEFLTLMKRWSLSTGAQRPAAPEDRTEETFRVFDMDGNGYIDKHELRYIMSRLGENPSEEDIKAMFEMADTNNDGLIDYEEFKVMMSGLAPDGKPAGNSKKGKDAKKQRH